MKQEKRRVPDSLRRRTLVSCDRCKIRRIRCTRANEHESCASCVGSRVKCESTLPRKQRVYGSVERFSLRYRALDALVRGLFPAEDTDDIDTLFRLAKDRGIPMPSADDQSPAPDAFRGSSPTVSRSSPLTAGDSQYDTAPSEVFEERLIPAPHGVSHYVGPVSSFDFASTIRQLVAKYNRVSSGLRALDEQRRKLQADFANMKVSKAMEPRIRGHPATVAAGGRRESGPHCPVPSRPKAHEQQLYSTLDPPPSETFHRPPDRRLRDLLPPRDVSDGLIRAFFDHVHPNFTLFHRGVFQLRYESLWHPNTSQAHEPETGWACAVFMMLVLGAETLGDDSDEAISIQSRYIKMVRDRFENLAFTASLANIQALLLLQLYEHNSGERNTAWMFLGLAARMAIALGMHREGTNAGFDSIERNTRRMVWWTLYMFEQNFSILLGRPPSIDPMEVNTAEPEEAIFDGGDFPPDYHSQALALIQLAPRIKRLASALSPKYMSEDALLLVSTKARQMLQELQSWKSQLPEHLTPNWHFMIARHRRAVLMMHIYYFHFRSIVTRPFLVCRVNRDIDRQLQTGSNATLASVSSQIDSLSQDCRSSAKAALDHVHQLSIYGLLEGVAWMDFYYVYHAMMVMSLDLLGRLRDSSPDSAEEVAYKTRLSSMIDLCQRSRLAPTYRLLSRVAIDLALITGVGDEPSSLPEEEKKPEIADNVKQQSIQGLPSPQQFPPAISVNPEVHHQGDFHPPIPELMSDLYQYGTNEMPWDFFNIAVGGNGNLIPGSSQQMPAQFANAFDGMGLMNHAPPNNWSG
jgi:proline utilization trans-activator